MLIQKNTDKRTGKNRNKHVNPKLGNHRKRTIYIFVIFHLTLPLSFLFPNNTKPHLFHI